MDAKKPQNVKLVTVTALNKWSVFQDDRALILADSQN